MVDRILGIDLADLSRQNYLRHPFRRWFALSGGVSAISGFSLLDALALRATASTPSEALVAYMFIAFSLLFAYLCFAVGWWLFRAWAPPPTRLTIRLEGVDFELSSGKTLQVRWAQPESRMDIVVRKTDPRTPPESMVWVIAFLAARPVQKVWAPIVPDAFIPEHAVRPILDTARIAGATVREESYLPAFSGDPARSWKLYRVSKS